MTQIGKLPIHADSTKLPLVLMAQVVGPWVAIEVVHGPIPPMSIEGPRGERVVASLAR